MPTSHVFTVALRWGARFQLFLNFLYLYICDAENFIQDFFFNILTKINLWDTWGLDGETYSGPFLLKLLEGNVPSDFQMENVSILYCSTMPPIF